MSAEVFNTAFLRAERDRARATAAELRGQIAEILALVDPNGDDPIDGAIRELADGRARMDRVITRMQRFVAELDGLRSTTSDQAEVIRKLTELVGDTGLSPEKLPDALAAILRERAAALTVLDAFSEATGLKANTGDAQAARAAIEAWVVRAQTATEALEQVRVACRPETKRLANFANHINKVQDVARVREYLGAAGGAQEAR